MGRPSIPRLQKTCVVCDKVFQVLPCKAHRLTCGGRVCKGVIYGESVRRRSPRVSKKCKACGVLMLLPPSIVKVTATCGKSACQLFVRRQRNRLQGNPRWKGGVKRERVAEMARLEYKIWRNAVFKRDRFTCRLCLTLKPPFNAHHRFPWAEFPQKRYLVSNGVTLCKACHKGAHASRFNLKFLF